MTDDIVRATASDVPALACVLASAYAEDPVWSWLMPRDRDRRLRLLFTAHLAQQVPAGRVWTDRDRTVAAVWAEPGAWKLPVAYLLRNAGTLLRASRTQLPRTAGRLLALEHRHPARPAHWYVEYIGTRADARGTGRGSVVLGGLLERADADGRPVFLESSNSRNLTFYRRHGFEVREEMTFRSGPPMWSMWRR
ncbi:GNAT family N-acetyltransferase [Streptomyces drozdowiczii]|uniref:GNAT family N-acetyltransferase n=1 Tax=Streptomyces drozdowiczii TaxID=202862 RepID=A0ABY6PWY4_9ACTN|nr:GNAT family N-acetyltransferase [Streptomyces drozdowiczii]MCX0243691.1 GNAT family N-acetyltransferase [Streptomyces drozdowiczii]UZK56423.1 GNAT family N-acetyltransferase [Streptomyces drozdowiczii]